MRNIPTTLFILSLCGCTSYPIEQETKQVAQVCAGDIQLPGFVADRFESIDDAPLLDEALGSPKAGKLCQGQVYRSKENTRITLFRAWNSTNPNSKFGKWWAFQVPSGKISSYRSDYEICYQWSPLDMLVSCTLKPDTKVVVGTGQSAECSEYLTYPVSEKKQVYLDDASSSLTDCKVLSGEFSWQ